MIGLLGAALVGTTAAPANTRVELTAEEIVHRAVERAQKTGESELPDFKYTKVSMTEELDGNGRVRERKERVYNVESRDGDAQSELVAVNGRPPTNADRRKQSEQEMNFQQLLGQEKDKKSEGQDNFLTPAVAARFKYSLVGKTDLNGRTAYQVSFAPKNPDWPARGVVDRLLNRVSGTLWIDSTEYEIARADVLLGSEVNLLGGIAGSLKKLAYTMVRTRVGDGIWFNTLTRGDFEGRKLFESTRIKTWSEVRDFETAS